MLICVICGRVIANVCEWKHYGVCEHCNCADLTEVQKQLIKETNRMK